MSRNARKQGFSLVEVVIFIVVVGVGFAGILVLYNQLTKGSVDPLVRKQALAIAASVLEEIQLRAFTYCDPSDANVFTASSSAGCATTPENIGPESGDTTRAEFDNVSDYHDFKMGVGQSDPNISTLDGNPIAALAGYSVETTVAVIAQDELPTFKSAPGANEAPVADALRVTVIARHPDTGISVTLQGYRTRYAPNSP